MDQSISKAQRLQAIRDRWYSEPLKAHFPALTDDPSTHQPPTTSNELVTGSRVTSAFSSFHANPELAGMSPDHDPAADRCVGLSVSGGRLTLNPHPRCYTLSELVEQCDVSAPLTDEERQWLDSPPVGREEF